MRWSTWTTCLALGCLLAVAGLGCDDETETGTTPTGTGGTGGAAGSGGGAGDGGAAATGGGGGSADTGSVTGTISLSGSVTCGSNADNDCQGLLLAAAMTCGDPQSCQDPVGVFQSPSADLGAGAATYQIDQLPAGDTLYIFATLLETETLPGPPEPGDLVNPMPPPSVQIVAGSAQTVDLTMERFFIS